MMTKHFWNGLFFILFSSSLALSPVFGDGQDSEPRQLAPGTMTVIHPFINYSETFQWSDVPEIAAEAAGEGDTSFDWAKNLYFSKEIWCLEFSFKPIRFALVDFPNEEGKMDRKVVWYMLYSVTNTGKFIGTGVSVPADNKTDIMVRQDDELVAEEVEQKYNNLDGIYAIKEIDYQEGVSRLKEVKEGEKKENIQTFNLETIAEEKIDLTPVDGKIPGSVRFSPQFIIATQNLIGPLDYKADEEGFYRSEEFKRQSQTWNDRYLPLALVQIAAAEDPNQTYQSSISFPAIDIAPGQTYWGIATWTDIDPRVNNFTVYISGLTNALRWTDDEAKAYNKENLVPMTGRNIFRKVLKLNFYRPGDTNISPESKVYFGVPGQKASEWVFM